MRPVSWVKAALKAFEAFPAPVKDQIASALDIAASGEMAEFAKPMKGFGTGVFEVAIPFRSNAFRAVYAVKIDSDLWVVHAFQKKSTQGIKTPQHEIDVIRDRLKRLREMR